MAGDDASRSPGLDLALSGRPGSVPAARDQLRSYLEAAALPGDVVYDALLITTELVSNAVRHAPGPCRLVARITANGIEIAVRDTAPDSAPRTNPAHRFPQHHGVGIVTALTGTPPDVRRADGGKVVTAVLPCPTTRSTPAPSANSRTSPCLPAESRSRPAPPGQAAAR
ncbi:ATP-binding protein (plasmid) [Streptomycetaceae bacterium NBC_01309]